jgi:PAS domain S-box-containing protein
MNEDKPFVFVIDDDSSMRESLRNLMGSAGFAVRTFASAQEFLTSQRPDGPACLVLDVQLPGISGLDLQQELAKVAVQIPIIFITGHSDIPTTFRAMKAGAIEFLTKPFRDEDLLNAVERAQRTESAKAKSDVPLEASIPDGAVPLESILRTEELYRRPSRPPDYGKENRALVALSSAMADSPRSILQTLAEKVLEVLQADSAGLSLLTKDEKRFYWAAIAGAWQPHIGGGTPRNFGPCGDVLDRNTSMLFTHWERRYPYLRPARPLAEEGLLVPFYVNGKAVGTIWAIAHTDHRKFDAEDLRLLESLGQFASAAYQVVASIDDLKSEIAAREKAEAAVLKLATGLEAKIRRLVNANIIGICIWNVDGRIIEANEAFLRIVGYDREDLLLGRVSWREVTPDKWRAADEQALAELAATGVCEPFEKEYFRQDGNRVPVLVGGALLEGSGSEGVAFVLDLSEQKRAEEALRASEQVARSHVEVMMRSLDVLATEAAPEKFIAEMLRTIGQHLHACAVLLWLRNQEDDSVRLHLMIEGDQQVAPDPEHPYVRDPRAWKRNLQEMLFTKGPMVCDDIEQDLRIGAELREYMMNRGRKKFLVIPMFVLGEVRGFIGIHHLEGRAYRPEEVELAQALAHHVMIAIHEAKLGEQRRRAVILEERTRMARDIHDTLAQGFTGIIVQLEVVANAISRSKPKKVNKCLQRAADLARRSLNEARRSVHALRPEVLEHVNFWEALKGIIKNTAAATTIRTKSRLRGKLPQLRLDWQEDLMHIGQEALTNALKYAHADTFETRLVCHAKKLCLEFQDDGDGFNIKDQHDGVGLTGMRERVAQMGGELKITSARGKGTKITVVLPCNGRSVS